MVNTVNLAEIAVNLKLGEKIYLSKGEEDGGGRNNPSILANSIEAIIGGLFLDGGIDKAEDFIKDNVIVKIDEKIKSPLKDAKSRLQELVQAQGFSAPKYEVVEEKGPDHNKIFTLEVSINGKVVGKGEGKNKSEAAQDAANSALDNLS